VLGVLLQRMAGPDPRGGVLVKSCQQLRCAAESCRYDPDAPARSPWRCLRAGRDRAHCVSAAATSAHLPAASHVWSRPSPVRACGSACVPVGVVLGRSHVISHVITSPAPAPKHAVPREHTPHASSAQPQTRACTSVLPQGSTWSASASVVGGYAPSLTAPPSCPRAAAATPAPHPLAAPPPPRRPPRPP
jgi:hypothetical protein